ncbi:type II toxin-antitoxin system antitoxin SocA domain-containing protein [Hallella colorans]|uniref:type II toxin-antitoxin system antitoxin SocA domain-containing protein n=1 Tax=Hallella colorans TaxID=1703337 RepID=UPI0023F40C40|nr:type II toxin-antitoxin system antitoxin SocA domain-containing protein [Hallella colorans]
MEEKKAYFEYLIDSLIQRNNCSFAGFTTLKLIKLLFLVVGVSSTEQERGLTTIFDKFVAMPYGPVESDIYNFIQNNALTKYSITSSQCKIKNVNTNTNLHDNQRQAIDNAIDLLLEKNPRILQCQPFELVDITHKWSCWRICYNWALENRKKSIGIPSRMIQNSVKYYQ